MKRRKVNYVPGPSDLCQTPAYALEPLIEIPFFNKERWVWECAAGEGYLYKGLYEACNGRVLGTDIYAKHLEQHDFLSSIISMGVPFPNWSFDCIVTNPPYSIKDKFIRKCYEIHKPWALLMPVDTIGNKYFIELANKYSPKPGIIFFSPRVNFKMPNKGWKGKGAHYSVAWFTWNMGFEGNIYKVMEHWNKEYREEFEI